MSRLEWQLQALVAGYNVVPVLAVALLIAWIGFVAGPVTGLVTWFLGAIAVAFLLAYVSFCLITAVSLWQRKSRARFAAIFILLLYLCLHYLVASSKPPAAQLALPWLKPDPKFTPPAWFVACQHAVGQLLRLSGRPLTYLNIAALALLLLRWKQFSRSVRPGTE
jgi:hypothetical protein